MGTASEHVSSQSIGRASVSRRHVFYISGFDPKGPAWYHKVYRREARKQARLADCNIEVGERQSVGEYIARWEISWSSDGRRVHTLYDFLRWDDIMRHHWPRGPFRMLGVMAVTYWPYVTTGLLYRVLRNTWATFIAGAYPAAFLILLVAGTVLTVTVAAILLSLAGLPGWIAAVLAIIAAYAAIVFGSRWLDANYGIYWLIRIYAFNLLQARRQVPDLDERMERFADHVAAAAKESKADEFLLIGHSTGAQLAVSLLARILARPDCESLRGRLSLLTLGGSIPMLAWLPEAGWFRDELARVAAATSIPWIDFTVAQDGATFALLNPLKLCAIDGPSSTDDRPKLLSTKLFELFSREGFSKVHRDWRTVHFHYLSATEQQGDYDYFAITAGPSTLVDRYAHRETTKSFDRFKLRIFR